MSYITNWLVSGFSDTKSIIAQIVGFAPLILAFFVFWFNNRKKIIFFKMCSDLLWAVHFIILGELSGGIINGVNTLRNIIFAQKGKKWASGVFIPIFFCIFTAICTLLSFEGIKSFFPLVGSCFAIIGFWQNDVKNLRRLNFIGVFLWLIYGIWTVSIPTIISNTISIFSIIFSQLKKQNQR